jgi:hypothetical protein
MVANRLPLVGITVAALPYANTPIVLTLHWHGFVEVKLADLTEAATIQHQSVPSSCLQVNTRWDRFEDLELDTLETAWELGAWSLERHELLPYERPAGDGFEAIECQRDFGSSPLAIEGIDPLVADVPDADDLIGAAARAGYYRWLFRPVRGGVWQEVTRDVTLEPGGYRNPPCPHVARPCMRGKRRSVVYEFGREGCW